MNHIAFIIVSFLIFYKTFAFKYFNNCSDGPAFDGIDDIVFLSNHQIELILEGPKQAENSEKTNEWVNEYTENSILNVDDCTNGTFNCNTIYQGQYHYTRADNYDPNHFFSPGENIGVGLTVYAKCFQHIETVCLTSCWFTAGIIYNPPS
ncbi:uncharacterized protein OCT59_007947 [Rhizophagus irregularis]|uniref:Uncharacterized protein n=1 Tax=Rhizophagus irregularis (strain DAOM 181602 / DAOM 197198 / MUCL 43194) TaxID=747089 RepID=U9TMD9_RHIID|nr:hypothetical protein GLOIN_2v1789774 [Rhizophagus irregularis DAOM 181602=DAOM 197198]POG58905.1 hypothetical protein GLOIN_2v1789774 [Rhizophagus irregularis DAOM 181602=DAOM 197198]UZO16562.1 hypothetical protein OCT59_007947 [Rhizophagus irregularis]GBC43004.1 hypothetical protein GLOIN_2v1789774 [Rhizophagus irregularis DAOM 181602=DAOM 197198]CAG8705557.1 7019_t:CDS:2 [Rhizophagus irregularis]|eukprot:XP_025165771.1 hypothetical protein GLOIN_2v1789774 [Rhizophagus irregularis DAOM 181602=DAOM 197198]